MTDSYESYRGGVVRFIAAARTCADLYVTLPTVDEYERERQKLLAVRLDMPFPPLELRDAEQEVRGICADLEAWKLTLDAMHRIFAYKGRNRETLRHWYAAKLPAATVRKRIDDLERTVA